MASTSQPYQPSPDNLPLVSEFATPEFLDGFDAVERDESSWAGSLPASQGLYDNENEKDSCGVGFICQIQGMYDSEMYRHERQTD